eukprot:gene4540-14712_t
MVFVSVSVSVQVQAGPGPGSRSGAGVQVRSSRPRSAAPGPGTSTKRLSQPLRAMRRALLFPIQKSEDSSGDIVSDEAVSREVTQTFRGTRNPGGEVGTDRGPRGPPGGALQGGLWEEGVGN